MKKICAHSLPSRQKTVCQASSVMTAAGWKSKSRIPWIGYIGGTEKRGCTSSSRQRHAFKPTSSFCTDLILATATAGNLVHMVTFSSYSSIFAPSSTGLISLSGKNTERQNGSRMYPTHRPLSRHCVEATAQYMHYIKLGVLHSFRGNCIHGWQFGKVADNGVSNTTTSETTLETVFWGTQISINKLTFTD